MFDDGVARRLATKIREEREARGWTLAELAVQSGVSRAMLSKVEREEASPTAVLLGRISAAFGLTLAQLFTDAEVVPQQIIKRSGQSVWRDPETGFMRRALSPSGVAPLDLVWCELPPGAEIRYPATAFVSIEDQQIVMIEGRLSIIQGQNELELEAEDCMRFGSPEPTLFKNPGKLIARYVVVTLRKR